MKQLDTIKKLCDEYSVTAYEIAKNTSLSQPGIQAIINGEVKKPRQSTINKILDYIESKIVNTNTTSEPVGMYSPKISRNGVPYYPVDFASGYDSFINDQTIQPAFNISYKPYNDAEFWIDNVGHSMMPKIDNGDIVALKTLKDINQLIFGEIYAIVMPETRTIKYVRKSKKPNCFKIVPENLKDYDPQDINIDLIEKIFVVLGSIKKFF